jgi:aldehyde:ferredoxin oxidoreductase
MGAPFGAKNLKAVVVRGTKGVNVFDPEAILEISQKQTEKIKEAEERRLQGEGLGEFEKGLKRTNYPMIGPTSVPFWFKSMDIGVIGNYEYHELEDWPEIKDIKAPEWANKHLISRMGCFGCSNACMSIFRTEAGTSLMRCFPYWWQWKVWISDLNPIFEASRLCADYGLENGSVATMVGWLMHAYNEGLITAKDTDGVAFERGSTEALLTTVHKMAQREGVGDILAEGPLAFVRKLGGDRGSKAEALLMHRRGLVPRTVDMRTGVHYALEEAVASRGNSHRAGYPPMIWPRSWTGTEEETRASYERAKKTYGTEKAIIPYEYEGKAKFVMEAEHHHAIQDTLMICGMVLPQDPMEAKTAIGKLALHPIELAWLNAATGLELDEKYLLRVAERVLNIERAFNVREGITRKDDQAPTRWFTDPIPKGFHKGRKLDRTKFEKMKSEYYSLRGWDVTTGVPTRKKLEELGLKDIANNLKKFGKLPPKKDIAK